MPKPCWCQGVLAEQCCSFSQQQVTSQISVTRKATSWVSLAVGVVQISYSERGCLRANDLTEVCLPPGWFHRARDVVNLDELLFLNWKLHFTPQASSISQSEDACLSLAELLLLFVIVMDILLFHSAHPSLVACEHHGVRSVKFCISRQLTLFYLKRKGFDEE